MSVLMLQVLRVMTDNYDWNTKDELEIDNFSLSSSSGLTTPNEKTVAGSRGVNFFSCLF
jgi:hypothetical protein